MSAVWNCPACSAANEPRVKVCDYCGYERAGAPASKGLAVHREVPPRALVRGELDAETRARLDALYAAWGMGRRFGERQADVPEATPEERAEHARRKRVALDTIGQTFTGEERR